MAQIYIYSTNNYEKFNRIQNNRDVVEGRVKSLVQSIQQDNLLYCNPIKVNEDMEVIDGQHRLEAAKRMGVDIYYVVVHGDDGQVAVIEKSVALNSNQWAQTTRDYLKLWAGKGIQDYMVLKEFCEAYGVSATMAVKLLEGRSLVAGSGRKVVSPDRKTVGGYMHRFKNGQFKVAPGAIHKAEILVLQLNELQPFCLGQLHKSPAFMAAIQDAYGYISHAKFINKLKTHGFKIERKTSKMEYLRHIEDLYNYKSSKRVRLYQFV